MAAGLAGWTCGLLFWLTTDVMMPSTISTTTTKPITLGMEMVHALVHTGGTQEPKRQTSSVHVPASSLQYSNCIGIQNRLR